eukprot:m.172978 g.172978  ORF g.172978 m.172978 type:complete len:2357 (+) comp9950_c2_seq19:1-7071(+)
MASILDVRLGPAADGDIMDCRAAPGLQHFAVRDGHKTLRVCNTIQGDRAADHAADVDALQGIALHEVEQYEWSAIRDDQFHALVAVDSENTLSLLTLAPMTATAGSGQNEPAFAMLQLHKVYGGRKCFRSEMPLLVLRQALRKRGYDVSITVVSVIGPIPGGVCLFIDHTYVVSLQFTSPTHVHAACIGLDLHGAGPLALPTAISQGPAAAIVVASDTLSCVCRVHHSGTATLHRRDTGSLVAVIHAADIDVPEGAVFTAVALSADGVWLTLLAEGRAHIVNLNDYFAAHPTHRSNAFALAVSADSADAHDRETLNGSALSAETAAADARAESSDDDDESDDDDAAPAIVHIATENTLWARELADARQKLCTNTLPVKWFEPAAAASLPSGPSTSTSPCYVAELPGSPARVRMGSTVEVWVASGPQAAQGGLWIADPVTRTAVWLAFAAPVAPVGVLDDRCCSLGIRAGMLVAFVLDESKKALADRLIKLDASALAGRLSELNGWDNISLNLHQLEAALQFRQLELVATLLAAVPPDQLDCALGLVVASVQRNRTYAMYSDFAAQLLAIGVTFAAGFVKDNHARVPAAVLNAVSQRVIELRAVQKAAALEAQTRREDTARQLAASTSPPAATPEVSETPAAEPATVTYGPDVAARFAMWATQDAMSVVRDALIAGRIAQLQLYASLAGSNGIPPFPVDGSLRSIQRAAFDVVFHTARQGNISDAVRMLSNMGEDVPAHLREMLLHTVDASLRTLLSAPSTTGLLPPAVHSAKEFCKTLQQTHPNGSFGAAFRNLCLEDNAKEIIAPSVLPASSRLSAIFGALTDLGPGELNLAAACGDLQDAPDGWSAVVRQDVAPAAVASAGYVQTNINWVNDWDPATRARILMEARLLRSLEVAHLSLDIPLAAALGLRLQHGHLDAARELFDAHIESERDECIAALAAGLVGAHEHIRHAMQLHVLRKVAVLVVPAGLLPDAVPVESVVALLCRSLRLFDPECVGGLPDAVRASVHDYVLSTCARLELQSFLVCYVLAHQLPLPASLDSHDWIAPLRGLLAARTLTPDDKDSFFPQLFAGLPLTDLGRRPQALLAAATYKNSSMYGLVDSSDGVSAEDLLVVFAGKPVALALFFLNAETREPASLASLLQGNVPYEVHNIFATFPDVGTSLSFFLSEIYRQYSQDDVFDYRYYLQQGRPSTAWSAMLSLETPADIQAVFAIAVENFRDPKVEAACLTFLRFLPSTAENSARSLLLKDYAEIARRIFAFEQQQLGSTFSKSQVSQDARRLSTLFIELNGSASRPDVAGALAARLEKAIKRARDKDPVPAWRLLARFCRLHGLPASTLFLEECARNGNWLMFLSAAQENLVPPLELAKLVEANIADDSLKAHLLLVLRRLHPRDLATCPASALYPPLGRRGGAETSTALPLVDEDLDDLIDVILSSLRAPNVDAVQRELCSTAISRREPLLAAFAGLYSADKAVAAVAWLYARVPTLDASRFDYSKARDHSVLLALFTDLAQARQHIPMLEVVALFDPSSSLLHFVRFHAAFAASAFPSARQDLAAFMVASQQAEQMAGLGGPRFAARVADEVVQVMYARCATAYERLHLLAILADVKFADKYALLAAIHTLLLQTDAALPTGAPDALLPALVGQGLFDQARSLATAYKLDRDSVTIAEAQRYHAQAMASSLWQEEQTRATIWGNIDELFVKHGLAAVRAGEFFIETEKCETHTARDRIKLLSLGDKWLRPCADRPGGWSADALAKLQKRTYKLYLAVGEGQFLHTPLELKDGWGTAEATAQIISDVESPCDGRAAEELTDAERAGLDRIIGQLLARGCLQEALNWAKVFGYHSKEVVLAQTAVLLALEALPERGMKMACGIVQNLHGLDIVRALRTLGEHCACGHEFFHRVLTNYLVSKALNIAFKSIMAEPAQKVLHFLLQRGESVFDLGADFVKANRLQQAETAATLSRLYIAQATRAGEPSWRAWSEDTFAAYARLLAEPSLLGRLLLDAACADPAIDCATEVDLLLRANQAYTLSLSMDGLGAVLDAVRARLAHFEAKAAWPLLVQLYRGLRQYRDTEEILHILYRHHYFELVLGQKSAAVTDPTSVEMKMALRDFLVKNHEDDQETLQMLSLHHSMFRAIGEARLHLATTMLRALGTDPPGPARLQELLFVVQLLREAGSMFLKEDCSRNARHSFVLCRLVGLQMQMIDQGILNLTRDGVLRFLAEHPRFRECLIVAEAYDLNTTSSWVGPIYRQVVELGNDRYFSEYLECLMPSPALFADVVDRFIRDPERAGKAAALQEFLRECTDHALAHKLAKDAGLTRFADSLLVNTFVGEVLLVTQPASRRKPAAPSGRVSSR